MPKKYHGENSKATVAKARKDALKQAEIEKKEREAEDALWQDDDKHVQRKQQRKEEKEKRKQDVVERKAASKQMLEEEMSTLKAIKVPTAETKVTRSQIAANKQAIQNEGLKEDKAELQTEMPLEENLNRVLGEEIQARTVEEAVAILSVKENDVDVHPERRVKAAYAAFEEENLPRLKAENPTLRMSQLKQILRKDWMKSPQNPLIHG